MRYLSVCSGIEAATAAWHPLGWRPVGFAEVDKFPAAVLQHHYPDVPNFGDMTKFEEWPDANVDVLVGGTPCQSFSVAGLRGGLDDARGNLMLVYAAIAQRYRPAWVAWENVPGVLSDDGGRGFASLLGLLAGRRVEVPSGGWESAGVVEGYKGAYGLAWRVLDAQFVRVDGFGRAVPQRRRRVFVVGYLGDWRRAAAVLFESEGLRGDPPPRRQAGKGLAQPVAGCLGGSSQEGGFRTTDLDNQGAFIPEVSHTLSAPRGAAKALDTTLETYLPVMAPEVANPLTARMFKGVNTTMDEGQTMIGEPFSFKPSHFTRGKDGAPAEVFPPLSADADKGDQDAVICEPMVFDETQITHPENRSQPRPGAPSHALVAGARPPAIAFSAKDHGHDAESEVAPTLRAGGSRKNHESGGIMPAVAFNARQDPDVYEERTGPLDTDGSTQAVLAWQNRFRGDDGRGYTRAPTTMEGVAGTLDTVKPWHIGAKWLHGGSAWVVRRLTPIECERLQGFPDDFTNIPWRGKNGAPDGPRYKVLGNSMAVNVMRWLAWRIRMVEAIK